MLSLYHQRIFQISVLSPFEKKMLFKKINILLITLASAVNGLQLKLKSTELSHSSPSGTEGGEIPKFKSRLLAVPAVKALNMSLDWCTEKGCAGFLYIINTRRKVIWAQDSVLASSWNCDTMYHSRRSTGWSPNELTNGHKTNRFGFQSFCLVDL